LGTVTAGIDTYYPLYIAISTLPNTWDVSLADASSRAISGAFTAEVKAGEWANLQTREWAVTALDLAPTETSDNGS